MRKQLTLAAALVICVVSVAVAGGITLTDGNSTAAINPDDFGGMDKWEVDGTDQLFQQWFWYRIGEDGGESSIDALGVQILDSTPTYAHMQFGGPDVGFDITISYSLIGGPLGSGASDIREEISINSWSEETLDFHFFQFSDFDLGGNGPDTTVQFVSPGNVEQEDVGTIISETSVSRLPTHYEAGYAPLMRIAFWDNNPTVLSDAGGPVGFNDLGWALQWDFQLAPGGSIAWSKFKSIRRVPEPFVPTVLLLGVGCTLLGLLGRKTGSEA